MKRYTMLGALSALALVGATLTGCGRGTAAGKSALFVCPQWGHHLISA